MLKEFSLIEMINKECDNKIKQWLSDNRSWIIDEWINLAKIPSIISQAKDGAPYGEACAKALKASAELFGKKGFDTEIYDKSGYALAKYGDGEKTIGLFCHSDVVPIGDDWIFTKPFEPIIKDNTLIGRGVSDNKSGIMASLCVMMMSRDLQLPIKSRLQTFIGSNEECGMEDIDAFAAEQPMPDISFIPDAEFPCSAGEKGIYHYWATAKDKLCDIKDFCGGLAFNVVLDKVKVKLAYSDGLKNELSAKIANNDKFNLSQEDDMLILLAKGVAKHASMPEGSENAAYLAASILCECEHLSSTDKKVMQDVARLTESGFGEGIELIHEDEFFGKLTMVNGIAKCENGLLKLSFDTRYGLISADEVEKHTLQEFEKMNWNVQSEMNSPGFNIPEDGLMKALIDTYNEITGKDEKIIYMGGGTYARHLKNAISVGTEEGKPNNFQMPQGHGGAHQCDEMIDIDGFFEAVRIIMHYVLQYEEMQK